MAGIDAHEFNTADDGATTNASLRVLHRRKIKKLSLMIDGL